MASTVTGMSGSGAGFGAALSLGNIGRWIGQVNEQMANSSTIGYKARRTNFKGNYTTQTLAVSPQGAYGAFRAEDVLTLGDTVLDFSQGTVINSDSPYAAAINGQGTFILTDDVVDTTEPLNFKTYYTRDGEFHVDPEGYLRTLEGLYVTNPEYSAGRLGPEQNAWHAPFDPDWDYREKIKIENKDPFFNMPAQSIAQFEIPLKHMLEEEKIKDFNTGTNELEDLRIIHIPTGAELPRNVTFNADNSKATVTFRLSETIPKLGSSDDYYIYYGNENAPNNTLTPYLDLTSPPAMITTLQDNSITPGGTPVLPFQDDFDDGVFTWINQPGTTENWVESDSGGGVGNTADLDTDRELRQTVNTGFETKAVVGNPNWNDYRFSVTMGNLDNDNDSVFVYGRWDETTNSGYRFRLVGNTNQVGGAPPDFPAPPVNSRRIEKVVGGAVVSTLYQDNVGPHPDCNNPAAAGGAQCPYWDYRVEMEFVGNAVRLFQDGSLIAEVFDPTPILAGKIGLGNSSQSAWYDDVDVQPPVQNAEITLQGRDGLIKFDHNRPVQEQLGWTSTFPEYTSLAVTHYGSTVYEETTGSGIPDYGNSIAQAGSTINQIVLPAADIAKFRIGDQVRVTGGRYANTSATGGVPNNLNVTAATGTPAFQVGDTVTITGGALNNLIHTTTIAAGSGPNNLMLTNQLVDSLGNPVTPTGGEYIKRVHHGDEFEVVTITDMPPPLGGAPANTLTVTPLLIAPDPGAFVYKERQDIIVGEALESSNAVVDQLVPELVAAQNMAESLAKIITVTDANLDIAFNLLR